MFLHILRVLRLFLKSFSNYINCATFHLRFVSCLVIFMFRCLPASHILIALLTASVALFSWFRRLPDQFYALFLSISLLWLHTVC